MTTNISTNSTMEQNGGNEIPLPILFAFGNAILDMSLEIDDDDVLRKFNLNKNTQLEIPIDTLNALKLYAEKRYGIAKYNPGGSSLNTCRILRSLGEGRLLFCGAIGEDDNAKILRKLLKDSNVNVSLQVLSEYTTAVCFCLISNKNRCLVADIGASLHFKQDLFESDEKFLSLNRNNNQRRIYYIEGYFVSFKIGLCHYIYETYCNNTENSLAFNLNAVYILNQCFDDMRYLFEKADIVFGNKEEFTTLYQNYNFASLSDLLGYLRKNISTAKRKLLIITDGENSVRTFEIMPDGVEQFEIDVKKMRKDEIIDTTGAGDSFVAGFFFGYLKRKCIKDCIRCGIEVACKTITQIGCHLPMVADMI